ncbi:hypothetical protein J6Z19_04920 [bacterium]|nr:hypothetical protein [bacterium]
MKKIIFLIVFCFVFPIFADGISNGIVPTFINIEIVPIPIKGVVGTDKIVIRGFYNSEDQNIRIRVLSDNLPEQYFSPTILKSIDEEADGFYLHDVQISSGNNTIILEKQTDEGDWTEVSKKSVKYDPESDEGKQSLWGRIANRGKHQNEEQRAIYFYPGTRYDRIIDSGKNVKNSDIFSMESEENFSRLAFFYSKTIHTDDNQRFFKNSTDTKGPDDFEQKCWSNKDTVNKMMDEISNANTNIVMFVYWGDNDETIGESQPEGYETLSENAKKMMDNYPKIIVAPTFPETCDYYLEYNDEFCIQYTDDGSHTWRVNERSVVNCQCRNDSDCNSNSNDNEKYCYQGTCVINKTCSLWNPCVDNNQICDSGKCVPAIMTGRPIWHHYFTHRPSSDDKDICEAIYTPEQYKASGIDPQGRQYDAIDQLFKAAADRNLLVVPTLEPSVSEISIFEFNPSRLKNRLLKLLRKYGNNPNWLQVYDKKGKAKKVIHISQAVSCILNEISFKNTLDTIAQEITQELNSNTGIGFLLDITAMPPDRLLNGCYFPNATELKEMDSFLGASTFGLPFDQYLTVDNSNRLKWSDMENNKDDYLPLEDHLFKKAKDWLVKWKYSGIPIIPDIIPGFDDRWRGQSINSVFLIYGDNEKWRERYAKLMFMYNTAGFNLTIWNGYGEGYVWVPYRKRKFENPKNLLWGDVYSIHPDYKEGNRFGNPPIPDDYANLKLTVDKEKRPAYEEEVIYDNYCFAQYLFGMDDDRDCVPNNIDNCPNVKNPDQADDDGDGVGNACDNCREVYNPPKNYELDSEFILGSDGANAKNLGHLTKVPLFFSLSRSVNINNNLITPYFELPKKSVYRMQPDSDLDGIGNACDYKTSGVITETPEKLGFANSKITDIRSGDPKFKIFGEFNSQMYVKLNMPENSGRDLEYCERTDENEFECNAAVHYCAIGHREKVAGNWGAIGSCSTAKKADDNYQSKYDFGYSHGSDDFSDDSILSWQHRISIADGTNAESWSDFDKARKPVKVSTSGKKITWNWRKDRYEFNDCLGSNKDSDLCQSLIHGGDYNVDNTMYYALSTSILPVKNGNKLEEFPPYMKYGKNGKLEINDEYFPATNTNKFARASRYMIEAQELNYYTRMINPPELPKPIEFPDIELCASCYFDMPIRYFGINEIMPYEYVSRYMIKKNKENNVLIDSQRIMFHKNQIAFGEISPKEMIGIESNGKEYFLTVNTSESGADWNRIGRIENRGSGISGIESFAANYFIAQNGKSGKTLYSIELISEIPQNLDVKDAFELPETVYTVNNLGKIGFEREQTKLVFANGKLYLFAQGGNSSGMFLFNGADFEEIRGVMPPQRNILNVSTTGKYMFLAGGTDSSNETMNDLWRFDTESNTWEQIPVELQGSFSKVIMQEVNGRMVAFNPVIDENTTFPVFEFENSENVENIEVSYSRVKIEDLDFEQSFCLNETDNSIFPGITNVYGECVKVENYDFGEVTFPDYKLSVAGYRNSLYLGGLTGIRRVETGENGEVTKKEMIYSGESNNLAVYGNTLYAANYSEIDIFEIAEDGSIERKSSVKTNDCRNIRIEGGKLFAAENKRVRIFDLNDPLSPELLKTISLSSAAEDLEVAGNKLFVYENLNGLLTRKGKITVFDVSDAANPDKINEFSQYCNDPEMQKSGNSVYLGCKNGVFKIEENGLKSVSGSKNYLREGYAFDGILYQVFSGTLHESRVEPEETEEDGWF